MLDLIGRRERATPLDFYKQLSKVDYKPVNQVIQELEYRGYKAQHLRGSLAQSSIQNWLHTWERDGYVEPKMVETEDGEDFAWKRTKNLETLTEQELLKAMSPL